eukprot:m.118785 g.118785  ORF g.118785 m.118785 type:complete len:433 (-) comp13664_c0_seq1:147-1445(-)
MDRASTILGHIASVAALESQKDDVVIIDAVRTPIGKGKRGVFNQTPASDLLATVLKAVVARTQVDAGELEDVVVGNVLGIQSAFMARIAQLLAGIPETVPVTTVNRQCSSGLQAIMAIAGAIRTGTIEIGIGAGVESMSLDAMDQVKPEINPRLFSVGSARDCLTPMGVTSDNVAKTYSVTRGQQDEFAAESHRLAAKAQTTGEFDDEIVGTIPMVPKKAQAPASRAVQDDGDDDTDDDDGSTLIEGPVVTRDEGVREKTTVEGLSTLKPRFSKGGTTTAGNSSQISDGAAAVLLSSRRAALQRGLVPMATIKAYAVKGVPPALMGIGPAVAIPAALDKAGLTIEDIDVFEINEAFASQIVYCIDHLKIPRQKVNPLGGAIALGHPLGCTGARQVATLVHYLRRHHLRRGIVSMCIGTGMGAAVVIEAEPLS